MNLDSQINEVLHLCGIHLDEHNYKDAMDYADSVEDIPYDDFLDKFSQDGEQFDKAKRNSIIRDLGYALNGLSEKEEYIIRSYYGINCEPKTTSEIGKILGIGKQRAEIILAKAERRMKHPSRSRALRSYLR